jgi:hypothetical protein
MITPHQILDELKHVKYPGFNRDIVSFGLVKDIEVGSTGGNVILAATTARDDVIAQILDADVYGPSVPLMLGLRDRPQSTDEKRIIPLAG